MNSTLDAPTIDRPDAATATEHRSAAPPADDVVAVPVAPLLADERSGTALRPTADAAVAVTEGDLTDPNQDDPEFRGFSKAILVGILLGIPILAAVVAAGVLLAAPDTDPWAVVGIAGWVSLFCGPFLAGTVTVGLWSSHNH